MSLSRDVIDRLPHVEGVLNYLAPMAEKPMNLAFDPPPGVARSMGVPEPHRMTIYDARPVAALCRSTVRAWPWSSTAVQ